MKSALVGCLFGSKSSPLQARVDISKLPVRQAMEFTGVTEFRHAWKGEYHGHEAQ